MDSGVWIVGLNSQNMSMVGGCSGQKTAEYGNGGWMEGRR